MKSHEDIDQRSLALARAVAAIIDRDPEHDGLRKARANCDRWLTECPTPVLCEWRGILDRNWQEVRAILLDEGAEGRRLRQSNPFCGILAAKERWAIYRRFSHEPKAA